MKKITAFIMSAFVFLSFCACSDNVSDTSSDTQAPIIESGKVTENIPETLHGGDVDEIISEFLTEAQEGNVPEAKEDGVRLLGDKIEYNGDGITVTGQTATVNKAGTYSFSGTLDNGQIIVDVPKTDKVTLIFDGVRINCTYSAPVYVKSCDKITLTLAEETVNTLCDGNEYIYDTAGENEPNAALFSDDDMKINGKGSLVVNASFNNGITSKNDLEIEDATVTVKATHDGIRGKDCVVIKSGTVNVSSGGDGIKSNNTEEADRGYIIIDGGTVNVSANEDGIQAEKTLTVNGGELLIKTGEGSKNSWSGNAYGNATEASAKALKAAESITVAGGTASIDSSDDAVHSNTTVTICGGSMEMSSGDDGIHADDTLSISGGNVTILKSYEGLEAVNINISGGNINVKASDDGINGAGGNDGSSTGGRPGAWGGMHGSGNAKVTVSGGYLYINSDGDGLDSNGSFTMTDGTVIVDGPTNGGNGPLDYDSSFTVSGGLLIAAGSSGMAQNVSASSTQCTVLAYVSGQGGDAFTISKDGESIITHVPAKKYECVLVSSDKLEKGAEYTVSSGTGTVSYTHSNTVSTAGSGGGMGGGGGMRPGGGERPDGGMRPPRF